MRWTEQLLIEGAQRLRKAFWYFSPTVRDAHLGQLALDIAALAPWTFQLGNFEGIIAFEPDTVQRSAQLHLFVWTPRFMRRPDLARAVLAHAFSTWGWERLTATIPAHGSFANRFAAQMGFTKEGTLRAFFCYPNGEPLDANIWGLLKGEL